MKPLRRRGTAELACEKCAVFCTRDSLSEMLVPAVLDNLANVRDQMLRTVKGDANLEGAV